MRDFELVRCGGLEEALEALSVHGESGKVIVGGVALLIVMKQRIFSPAYLIGIGGLKELNYIRAEEGGLRIGALTPHRAIERHPAGNLCRCTGCTKTSRAARAVAEERGDPTAPPEKPTGSPQAPR